MKSQEQLFLISMATYVFVISSIGTVLRRFSKINNPLAHEYTTGPEIIEAVTNTPSTAEQPSSGKVDVLIAGAGTGGTVSGLSRAIKKSHNPDSVIIGVDPVRHNFIFGRTLSS